MSETIESLIRERDMLRRANRGLERGAEKLLEERRDLVDFVNAVANDPESDWCVTARNLQGRLL